MRLILIGPPGSGKGTQAQLLCNRFRLLHFSTGDILREAIENETPEGLAAKPFMTTGKLVPDELVNEIVRARFGASDRPSRFVMDGYPRTLTQAFSFDVVLEEQALTLDAVVFLDLPDEEIVERISKRLTCVNAECGAVYHTRFKPPKINGFCDRCGHLLVQREDDKAETIRRRLLVFHQHHDEIVRYYRQQGLLVEVSGRDEMEMVYARIVQAVKDRVGER